uniref:Gustatory receptor n=1 Tax=Phlebotomus papatasi TaxID=29031 RepID=A0A3F2ZEI7_PHLPP
MLSVLETLGYLYKTQKFISLFDFKLGDGRKYSKIKRRFVAIISRIPIGILNFYISCIFISSFINSESYSANDQSVTVTTISILNFHFIHIFFFFSTIYFAIRRRKHLELIDDVKNLENKVNRFMGDDVFRTRQILKKRYNFQCVLILLHDFSYYILLITQIGYSIDFNSYAIFWYIFLILQGIVLDCTALYITGYINVFMDTLESFDMRFLSSELRIQFHILLVEYGGIIKRINSLFLIFLIIYLGNRVIDASVKIFYLFVIMAEVPLEHMKYVIIFATCCSFGLFGSILVMLTVTLVGDRSQTKMDRVFRKMASFNVENTKINNMKYIENLNTKYFLLKNLHEPMRIKVVGGDKILNLNLLFAVLTQLSSNLMVLIQFKQYEDTSTKGQNVAHV